ncbi:MAG TPA: DUF2167 domain-containing protein [Candidatus Angelobacter sp.]|nr:DUF2167 domain-containing protein [Candidatus Angelobacter sp.]
MKSKTRTVVQFFMASRRSRGLVLTAAALLGLSIITSTARSGWAQEPAQTDAKPEQPKIKIDWQVGPTTGKMGDIAEIKVPEGYRFTDKVGTQKLLQLTHNLTSGHELGAIVANDADWFMIFEFDETGYVKDDEGDKLDADAILKSLTENTDSANPERAKRGWTPIHVKGWQRQPFYDPQTHNLTWASLLKSESTVDDTAVNHSVRILGRHGTMNVDLVASPAEYAGLPEKFNGLMAGFHYTGGNRYSDFAKGDKIAEYGLTALIVGGGAAVALKTGLFAKLGILLLKLWKFIMVGLIAAAAAIKKAFQAIFGKEEKIEDPNKQAMSQGQ